MPKKQRNRAPKYPQIQRFAITFSRDGHGVPTYTLNELHEYALSGKTHITRRGRRTGCVFQ